jgi:signal transduction histidine kinase
MKNSPEKEELNRQKLSAISKFASAASHDLKNPLSSIKNIAYYFKNSVKLDGETPNKMLRMLSSEADRLNSMIVDLLDMTRVKQLVFSDKDLSVLIGEVLQSVTEEKFVFDLDLQNVKACVDPERFKQVMRSVIKNAKEAMENGGRISVKAYRNANLALVEISDEGKGMDEPTLEQCFDPLFTTKQSRALGMSLAVSKQIIEMSGGSIEAQSRAGSGTKIIITLPASDKTA